MNVSITSYGVLHGQAPRPTTGNPIRVDLTTALRNPASDPRMIDMTGLDPKVSQHVLNTPGADLGGGPSTPESGNGLINGPDRIRAGEVCSCSVAIR